MVRIIVFIIAVGFSFAMFAGDSGFTSPNKAFVVVATADSHRPDSYAIRTTADRRTLALASCPDDARCSGASRDLPPVPPHHRHRIARSQRHGRIGLWRPGVHRPGQLVADGPSASFVQWRPAVAKRHPQRSARSVLPMVLAVSLGLEAELDLAELAGYRQQRAS